MVIYVYIQSFVICSIWLNTYTGVYTLYCIWKVAGMIWDATTMSQLLTLQYFGEQEASVLPCLLFLAQIWLFLDEFSCKLCKSIGNWVGLASHTHHHMKWCTIRTRWFNKYNKKHNTFVNNYILVSILNAILTDVHHILARLGRISGPTSSYARWTTKWEWVVI